MVYLGIIYIVLCIATNIIENKKVVRFTVEKLFALRLVVRFTVVVRFTGTTTVSHTYLWFEQSLGIN